MKTYPISNRNRVKRISNKSDYSKETVHAIIDEALFCHLGIIHDGKPVVIPTIHARMGDHIVFHGSNASRLLKISNNNEICVTITLLDGLVMARSLFNSSMNYRSAVIFGKGEIIKEEFLINKRPGLGLSPDLSKLIIGQKAKLEINEDTIINLSMIDFT